MARIAVFISFSGAGGVERMVLNLLDGFISHGHHVDLLPIRVQSAHLQNLSPKVNIISLGSKHSWQALLPLTRYLRQQRPQALLAVKDRAIRVASRARRLAKVTQQTRLVGRLGTNLSAALANKHAVQRWWRCYPIRNNYRYVDQFVAVSQGVADDLCYIAELPQQRVVVVPNPVITPQLKQLAQADIDHPWFKDTKLPIILGIGRLTLQKDFNTLIRAFASVRSQCPSRLLIFGEGNQRSVLEKLIYQLNLNEWVDLPGFVNNPFAYMANASLFVLSSAWEGSPNVLTEAMALGTPVVATDCPSGPREVLNGGQYSPLVPVGNAEQMAQAMLEVLKNPPDSTLLQQAVANYSLENSSLGYLRALNLAPASTH